MLADISAAFASASRLGSKAGLILGALENRAALAALELQEARQRLETAILWTLVSTVALLLGGITGTAVVAAIFWDTPQRVLALVILAVIEFGVAAGGGWYVYSRWRRWQLLEHSRDQLAKDSACLREIFSQNHS